MLEFGEISGAVVLGILEWRELGCCFGFRWLRGDFGLNWRVEWVGVIAGFWVRLGDELEEIWMELEGLDCWKGRGGRTLIFCKGRGGELEALTLSRCSLSLGDQGGEGGELVLVLSGAGTRMLARALDSNPPARALELKGGQSARRQAVNASKEVAERRESGGELLLEVMAREELKFKGGRECYWSS